MSVRQIVEDTEIGGGALIRHGLKDYNRDYALELEWWIGGKRNGCTTVLLKGCAEARYTTRLDSEWWAGVTDDRLIDYEAYKRARHAGELDGPVFVWGVASEMDGWKYIGNSALAAQWSRKLGAEMHEILVRTNHFDLVLVVQDITITETVEDPDTPGPAPAGA